MSEDGWGYCFYPMALCNEFHLLLLVYLWKDLPTSYQILHIFPLFVKFDIKTLILVLVSGDLSVSQSSYVLNLLSPVCEWTVSRRGFSCFFSTWQKHQEMVTSRQTFWELAFQILYLEPLQPYIFHNVINSSFTESIPLHYGNQLFPLCCCQGSCNCRRMRKWLAILLECLGKAF